MSPKGGRPVHMSGVFVIRVNGASRAGGEIAGDVLDATLGSLGPFQSYFELFRSIQAALDRSGSPRRACERRSLLQPPSPEGAPPPAPPLEGPFGVSAPPGLPGWVRGDCRALFFLRVFRRQNASWQGHIYWVDQRVGGYFRSVMELFELMDEAMRTMQEPQAGPPGDMPGWSVCANQSQADGEFEYEP